jgi:TetR/AcrR family transcriptional regulator, regulator of autoinduction and epiphytic fitness
MVTEPKTSNTTMAKLSSSPSTSAAGIKLRKQAAERAQAEAVSSPKVPRAKLAQPAAAKPVPSGKPSFKQQMLLAREEAIIEVVNSMLADKGFDAMTVDEVAAEVGVAKASLYKHFPSKEDLAAAAMVRMMERAQAFLATVPPKLSALDKLKMATRWMMQLKLVGQMPNLPSQNSSLRATLTAHRSYVDGLMHISDTLGGWIEEAQKAGHISTKLPALVVLYTLYARACDPVLEFLKIGGQYDADQMLDMVASTCFEGLVAR